MNPLFADRITDVPKSFIREILKVTVNPSIISFAGGLPNRTLFPVAALKEASCKVFDNAGMDALQYANSEGFLPLREYIAKRYREKQNLKVSPEDILITAGSQQGLDLLGKTLINSGDVILIEEPGYLGAIQAFSLYRPTFRTVPVNDEGADIQSLREVTADNKAKLMYTVPNFQNPAGISYSEKNRYQAADCIRQSDCILVQDDPYGELRFSGNPQTNFLSLLPDNAVLLGSFSKIVAPSMRIGWLVAKPALMDKLLIAKQASDLHTNGLAQRTVHQFLADNDIDSHIATITSAYGHQRDVMLECIERYFPEEATCTHPEGGMFLWVTLPENMSSLELFHKAIDLDVAFVPGTPFYINKDDCNTLRLNFSCTEPDTIREGIQRLGKAIETMLKS